MELFRKKIATALITFAAFLVWTVAVCCVDVQAIGPNGSVVGSATINQFVHELIGVHLTLYVLTDWLSLIPLGICVCFALSGLLQWIKRKQLCSVDFDLFVLGGFFAAVMAAYLLFEVIIINYRPVLINGVLEVSYPSSTTMLVLCVMTTAALQLKTRMKNHRLRKYMLLAITAFSLFMVVGRLISGVHWFSDIVGGVLLSAALIQLYAAFIHLK